MKKLLLLLLPYSASAQKSTTVKSGRWSQPSTWGGKLPKAGDSIFVNHVLTVDQSATTATITVNHGATLAFTTRSVTLDITGNLIVHGLLLDNNPGASIIHTIQISGVVESDVIGGGMDIENRAYGVWIRDGQAILKGAVKTAWLNLKDSLKVGANKVTLARAPTGWRPGDTLVICPTAANDYFFDKVCIKSVSGNVVTITGIVSKNYPVVKNPFSANTLTAEVLNITRNIKIQGSSGRRSHVNIAMCNRADTFQNVEFNYMGIPDRVGRYPLHFHMNGNGVAGSFISGCTVKYSGKHGYVPHNSNNIIFKNNISFDTYEAPYWWDPPVTDFDASNNSNGISYDSCVAALIRCDPPYRGYRMPGFEMQAGRDNSCTNCIVVGNQSVNGNGFNWGEAANRMDNVWKVNNLIAHNNAGDGILSWQNDSNTHEIGGITLYNNGTGIEYGAYHNGYKFGPGIILDKLSMFVHANAVKNSIASCADVKSSGALVITRHLIDATMPFVFKDCIFSEIQINELPGSKSGMYDFINCGDISKFKIINFAPGSIYRIQQSGKAWLITNEGTKQIDLFFK